MPTDAPHWLELDGTVNVRDVGGLPAGAGERVRHGVLIRSASLQHLTAADVDRLVHDLGVRRVVDLRTSIEVGRSGPGPMHAAPEVTVHHLSLYPDTAEDPDADAVPDPVMPWHGQRRSDRPPVVESYLRYLTMRPDSIVAALRAIAEPDGATVVHCAAGKDRTGVVVAFALTVVGVHREAIAADYGATESQLGAILELLARSDLYRREVSRPDKIPIPTADTMRQVLDAVDEEFGGVLAWLGDNGWTQVDTQRLRAKLLVD